MKIYFIDEEDKFNLLYQKLESNTEFAVTLKNTKSFRTAKNDFVIYAGLEKCNSDTEVLKKYCNLIIIATTKDEKTISELAFDYNAKDVIFSECNEDYSVERICKNIENFCEVII